MKYLLDTHILIWWITEEARVPRTVRDAIRGEESEVFVSVATIWEIEMKRAAGKLEMGSGFENLLPQYRFATLPILAAHVIEAANLPRHHKDPFDRLLVAQARVEGMTLVNSDDLIREYDVAQLRF